jgi:hypothetical protein
MAHVVKLDVADNPGAVGMFGADGVVADADFAAELIEKAWTAGRGWLSGGGDWRLETGNWGRSGFGVLSSEF